MHLIADGDRERASETLRRHYLHGRLTVDELGERLDLALRARTSRELRGALRDLPSPWSPGELASSVETAARAATRIALLVALAALWSVATLLLLVAFAVVVAADGSGTAQLAVAALWVAVTFLVWRTWRRQPGRTHAG